MVTIAPAAYDSKIEGNVIISKLDACINWMRKKSLWPMPLGLACCAIDHDGNRMRAVRYRSVWCGSDAIFSEAIRCHDRGRHSYLQNGPRSQTNLRPDAGTQMGDRHGRLCLVRGHVPQLRRSSRNRSTYSGGRLRQRLSTPS